MRVQNMESKNGNKVANQFIIYHEGARYFQSYETIIAKQEKGVTTLDEEMWDCTKTTGKYRNQFLGEGIAITRAKIESGEYKLANLN